jgi:ribonucleoside-diphosphate reductase beta chain
MELPNKQYTNLTNNPTNKQTLAEEFLSKNIDTDTSSIGYLTNRLLTEVNKHVSMGERYSFFPIKDVTMYKEFKIQEAAIWSSNEMDFSEDKKDYDALDPKRKQIIDYINALFSATDGIIISNILIRFLLEAKTLEEQSAYLVQAFIELVHSETYSLIINTLIVDPEERKKLFMAANNLKCVQAKDKWLEQYMSSALPIPYRRLAFACGEGIIFVGGFILIFYFKSKSKLRNIIFANEQISKDECHHRDMGIILYLRDGRLSDTNAQRIVREVVELEINFVDEMLPEPLDDLHPNDIKNYIKFIADHLLVSCGHPKIWGITVNEIPSWMREIGLEPKGNFYEVRIGNYKQSSIGKALNWKGRITGSSDENSLACSDPTSIDF